jgi:hypothetical protein
MSMNLSIYVGPYLEVAPSFEWYDWENVVTDGRMEARETGEQCFLIPNVNLPGIERRMSWERTDETPVVEMSEHCRDREIAAFAVLIVKLLKHMDAHCLQWSIKWGVVPCWS